MIKNFLNPKGQQNPITGSKVTTILLRGRILPIGWASVGESLPLFWQVTRIRNTPALLLFIFIHHGKLSDNFFCHEKLVYSSLRPSFQYMKERLGSFWISPENWSKTEILCCSLLGNLWREKPMTCWLTDAKEKVKAVVINIKVQIYHSIIAPV